MLPSQTLLGRLVGYAFAVPSFGIRTKVCALSPLSLPIEAGAYPSSRTSGLGGDKRCEAFELRHFGICFGKRCVRSATNLSSVAEKPCVCVA